MNAKTLVVTGWILVVCILVALLLYPQTRRVIGWQVRESGKIQDYNLRYAVIGEAVIRGFEKRATVAQKQDPLLQLQLIAYKDLSPERLEEMVKLSSQHPDNIPLLAAVCAYAMVHLPPTQGPDGKWWTADIPEQMETLEKAAARGARLDPANAYFLMMQAAAARETGDRAGFIRGIEIAGQADFFNDYRGVIDTKGIELYTTATPWSTVWPGALPNLTDYGFRVRHFAGVLVEEAAKKEQAGNVQEGIRLRQSLMRLSSLMRRDSSSLLSNLTGSRLVTYTTDRPGGSPPMEDYSQMRERFTDYLVSHNENALAEAIASEIEAGEQVRRIVQAESDPYNLFVIHRNSLEIHSTAFITLIGFLVLTISLGLLSRWQPVAARQPLAPGPAFGMVLATLIIYLAAIVQLTRYFGTLTITSAFMSVAIIGLSVVSVFVTIFLVRSLLRLRGGKALPATVGFLGVLVFSLLLTGPITYMAAWFEPNEPLFLQEIWDWTLPVGFKASIALLAALPVFAGIAGLVKRPFFSTAVQAGYKISLLLLLGTTVWFATSSIVTSSQSVKLVPILETLVQHEGRETARLAGLEWPEEIFIPKP